MKTRTLKHAAQLLALSCLTCHQVILTAPPGSSLALFANPEFIPANGGVSEIAAFLTEPTGSPVADGTVVQFFTNLGRIDEQGRTNDGVARVNLISDSRSGTATVRAFSGGASSGGGVTPTPSPGASPGTGTGGGSGASGSVQVIIGTALPATVQVTAFPPRVTGDPRTATIRAFVFDVNGNPVPNVPVFFSLSQGAVPAPTPTPSGSPSPSPTAAPPPSDGIDFLTSRGQPVFTNNSGMAEDVLIVRTPRDDPQRTVTVTATTSNQKTGSTTVVIN
jgi:hypothetical protein